MNRNNTSYFFNIDDDDFLNKVYLRTGAWIDGISFETKKGKKSGYYGGYGGDAS